MEPLFAICRPSTSAASSPGREVLPETRRPGLINDRYTQGFTIDFDDSKVRESAGGIQGLRTKCLVRRPSQTEPGGERTGDEFIEVRYPLSIWVIRVDLSKVDIGRQPYHVSNAPRPDCIQDEAKFTLKTRAVRSTRPTVVSRRLCGTLLGQGQRDAGRNHFPCRSGAGQCFDQPIPLRDAQHCFFLSVRVIVAAPILARIQHKQFQISAMANAPIELVRIVCGSSDRPVLQECLPAYRHQWLRWTGKVVSNFMIVPHGIYRHIENKSSESLIIPLIPMLGPKSVQRHGRKIAARHIRRRGTSAITINQVPEQNSEVRLGRTHCFKD